MTIPQAFQIALQHHQAGRLADAEALYRQILAAQPNHADALHHLGVVAHQVGRHDRAVEWIRQAIALDPNHPSAHTNLGEAYRKMGRPEEAISAFRRALELRPDCAETHYNLGAALRAKGQLDEAIAAYRRALELKPEFPQAHINLGATLAGKGQLEEAIAAYRRALELKLDCAEVHYNLGSALKDRGQFDEAIAAFQRALELKPDLPMAHNDLGNALGDRGRHDEAIAAFGRALKLKPDYPEAHNNLGVTLWEQGRLDEAIAAFHRALELKLNLPEAHFNLGNALRDRGQLDEAVAAYRRGLDVKPDSAEAYTNLGNALKDQGELDEATAAYRRALRIKPEGATTHSNLAYTLHFHPGYPRKALTEEHERWNRQFCEPLKQFVRPHTNDPGPARPLRIGYVSPDFRDHVVGRNLIPLFRGHDRRNFEILCYSGVVRPNAMTDEFRRHAREWRSTVGVGDEAVAEMIRQDGVDILVDLTQHMAGNRLPIFARKPAPIQVSFAGYPESTGLDAIEYRISDRYLEEGSADEDATRKEQVCLIDSFWCYDPCGMEVEVNSLPALISGTVIFGSLGNFAKVNDPVLKLWGRALGAVKDSRLLLWSPAGSHRRRTLEALEREGVEARRVAFVEQHPRREYLELYHRVDIVLDTFPYNGHTTNLDALWMGVPVVSLAGNTPVSRAGLSQLTNLGLPELVARSEDDYVRIAVELAGDLPRLMERRSTLRGRMERSVLMDAPRFARQIEEAYRKMWERWCAGQSPHARIT